MNSLDQKMTDRISILKKIVMIILFCCFYGNLRAQKESNTFRADYSRWVYYDAEKKSWGEIQYAQTTFVFNAYSNNDIVIYWASGKKEIFRRISNITENVNSDGEKYQISTILTEEGDEWYLGLYIESRDIILADKYGNKMQFLK